ncbi:unnamed protein product [marine sediment metagenome]|uniref:Uncharacterized protein n=1 Tax=marine sediment metagenome TaxID=412755 RepID=X1GGJ9_9ZZZZ
MVVSIERVDFLRDRKTRRWLNSNVYKVYLFRLLFEREKETRDLWLKEEHLGPGVFASLNPFLLAQKLNRDQADHLQ